MKTTYIKAFRCALINLSACPPAKRLTDTTLSSKIKKFTIWNINQHAVTYINVILLTATLKLIELF